jgi:hypothetical protein
MASRRRLVREAWDDAQARDLRELPGVNRIERPGSFGTYAQDTRQAGPKAPTLSDGPLYTGEWREEIDGNAIDVVGGLEGRTVLCSLRRPWPFVGFAVDVSRVPAGTNVVAGLNVIMRSARAVLLQNVLGGGLPAVLQITAGAFPWNAMTGILAGVRVELWISQNDTSQRSWPMKGNLWGYNAPGFGP